MFAYGCLYLLILAALSLQSSDLPPLAVSQYRVDDSQYYVIDIQTGEATPVQRTGRGYPFTGIFYGYNIPPVEIPFQSPYDESLKFVLVNWNTGRDQRLYILPVEGGEPHEIPQPPEMTEINCIGWFEETVSLSGEVHLCDQYWGQG
jgi:hypothetical protein